MKHTVSSWAKAVGYTFAHAQHGMDKATEWALHSMRKNQEKSAGSKTSGTKSGAKQAGNAFLRFVGETGEAYYRVYEQLKRAK